MGSVQCNKEFIVNPNAIKKSYIKDKHLGLRIGAVLYGQA
jgi:hypothetical protein